jgi:tetratricopeptide (TPR) repeat protein
MCFQAVVSKIGESFTVRQLFFSLVLPFAFFLTSATTRLLAEAGVLVVHAEDVQRHPVRGLQIGVEGDGGSAVTTGDGKARIKLAKDTKANSWVSLQILGSAPGSDLVMVSPWDYRTQVPSFENESENFVKVVVVQRGDRAALENGTVLASLTAKINEANNRRTPGGASTETDPRKNLEAVAKQYGLSGDELDQHIREWGSKATDPYEAGLAALYERNYPKATTQLEESLHMREEKLGTDQNTVTADQLAVRNAAFFLGKTLYAQGKYRESTAAFRRCLEIFADDPTVLNDTGVTLAGAGDYAEAETLFWRALATYEKWLGPDHLFVAHTLDNLAWVLGSRADYARAEALSRQALAIYKKALGPDNSETAAGLSNLARLLFEEGDYPQAEPLIRQALDIDEKELGPSHPDTAANLNNLAVVLRAKGDYAAAEPLIRRALAINEKALGSDHPLVAGDLNNLAGRGASLDS